jgi:phage regulator Rha-like protein
MANQLTQIKKMIYDIRGQKVMFDRDLAELYGVELKVMNQAVKRNIDRFPLDFMFQLTDEEWKNQRSQFVTFSQDTRKYKPFVFTEHGILMLSSVLNSGRAIEINIQIMRVFVKMRHYVISKSDKNNQIAELRKLLMLHIENTDYKLLEHDKTIKQIIIALNNLIEQPPKTKRIGFNAD